MCYILYFPQVRFGSSLYVKNFTIRYVVTRIHIFYYTFTLWAGMAQSVQRLGTDWTVWESNPGEGREFLHPFRPGLGPTQPPIQWVPVLSRW
jgi:hypothetical protein